MASLNPGTQKHPLQDQVTPYKISVLLLIDEYCKMLQKKAEGELLLEEMMTELQERELLITLLHLVQGADIELYHLIQKIQDCVRPPTSASLTGRLRVMIEDGVHGLMDLFQELPESLLGEMGSLHRSSVLGLFLRRMVLAFNKFMFSQIVHLHKNLTAFYQAWEGAVKECSMAEMPSTLDESLNISYLLEEPRDVNQDLTSADSARYSQRQAELFIAQQTSLLQHNATKALPPRELQQKLNNLLMNNPSIAEAHYLSYLNNLRISEYIGAMQNLHNFYNDQLVLSKSKTDEESLPKGFRYAALNMAALHFRFGHRAESFAALQEAIQLAQGSNDHVCLQHALGWLQRLGAQGTGDSAYMLDRLVTKAGELNLAYLTSLGVQDFAKHHALATAQPSSIFEFLLKSDIVNCQHSLSDLKCISSAQKASLWSLYGRREMCSLSSQGMLMLNTADLGIYHSGDAECTALCHMANLHMEQGEYEKASLILESAEQRFPLPSTHSAQWMIFKQHKVFTLALFHGQYEEAETAVSNMSTLSPLQAAYCRCLLLKEQGMVRSALDLSTTLLSQCEEKHQENPQLYARLLLLQGELHCCAGNATSAVKPLHHCLTLCRERHYSYMVALTAVHLALVQFYLDMPKHALSLMEEGSYLLILTHGCLYDRARTMYLWTRCHLAALAKEGQAAKKSALSTAVDKISQVLQCFRKVQAFKRAKDVIYFQARLYHELGMTSERNKCAHEFKALDLQYPTWKPSDICCL